MLSSFVNIFSTLKNIKSHIDSSEPHEDPEHLLSIVKEELEKHDVDFLSKEIPEAIQQSLDGIERVSEIVKAMKEFSHLGANEKLPMDLNRALNNTIIVSKNEWKYIAKIVSNLE